MVLLASCSEEEGAANARIPRCGFHEQFSLGQQLGSGAYSSVHSCQRRGSSERLAVKIFRRDWLSAYQRRLVSQEVEMLSGLRHRNIVRLLAVCTEPEGKYLVFELADYPDACAAIVTDSRFGEQLVKVMARQLFTGLAHLHQCRIVHRDIKLENILLKAQPPPWDPSAPWTVKICDFGYATRLPSGESVIAASSCVIGSCEYMSPEMASGSDYSTSVDCWAAGVALFFLFMGDFPFRADTMSQLLRRISRLQLAMPYDSPNWKRLSRNAVALLRDTFVRRGQRPSAAELLRHRWFTQPQGHRRNLAQEPGPLPIQLRQDRLNFLREQSTWLRAVGNSAGNNSSSDCRCRRCRPSSRLYFLPVVDDVGCRCCNAARGWAPM